jgi:hypothetical protein
MVPLRVDERFHCVLRSSAGDHSVFNGTGHSRWALLTVKREIARVMGRRRSPWSASLCGSTRARSIHCRAMMASRRFVLDHSITGYQNPGNARFDQNVVDFLASPIPEPTSFAPFAIGLTGLADLRETPLQGFHRISLKWQPGIHQLFALSPRPPRILDVLSYDSEKSHEGESLVLDKWTTPAFPS